jgi:O-antigen/teichoic acid export membrane protein
LAGAFAIWRIGRGWPVGSHAVSLRSGVRIATIYVLGFLVDWIAIVALGAWDGSAAAGIYRVAAQFGLLFMLVRNSFDQMAGAHLARAYAHGSIRDMVAMARRISLVGTAVCLPVLAVILVAPRWLMGLFGPEFETGATALVILACAQFAGVVAGPIGSILDMSHREQVTMRIEIGVAAVAIALQIALIPRYGIEGAAMAILAAIVVRSSALLIAVIRLQRAKDRGTIPEPSTRE